MELRRGDDYTIRDTAAVASAYAPEKLSMERVEAPAFTPEDRIGALEMQNLAISDNRALLIHLAKTTGISSGLALDDVSDSKK